MVCSIRLGVASIYSAARGPKGVGGARRGFRCSVLMAWATVGGGAVLPGEAQRRGGEAWGGADRSERFDALGGSDGGFDGAQRAWSARRRTGVSAGLLGRW